MGGQVGARRRIGVEVVVVAAVVGLRDRPRDDGAHARRVRLGSAAAVGVAHDVAAVPAVREGRRVRRRLLHAAQVVRDLVQHDRRLPVPRVGRGRARGQHHPRQAALVGEVAAAGRVVGRDLGDAPDAVDAVVVDGIGIVGGQAVGEDEHVARGRVDDLRDVVGHGVEVVVVAAQDVGAAVGGQVDVLDVDVLRAAHRAHVEAQRAPAARLQRQELLDARDVGLQRVLPAIEVVGLVERVRVDDLDLTQRSRGRPRARCRPWSGWRRRTTSWAGTAGGRERPCGQVREGERVVDVRGREVGAACRGGSDRSRRGRSRRAPAPAAGAGRRGSVVRGA